MFLDIHADMDELLKECARAGRWSVTYPEHAIPNRRVNIVINQVFTLVLLALVIAVLFVKYFM